MNKIMTNDLKRERIFIRLSEVEKAFIKRKAKEASMTLSRYCLRVLQNKKVTNNRAILRLVISYSKHESNLENNINQIAKKINTTNTLTESDNSELVKLLTETQYVRLRNIELMKEIIGLL